MAIKTSMNQRKQRPTDPPDFRDRLEAIVSKTGFVDQAVCLAVGQFDRVAVKHAEAFEHQLAFFLLLCEKFEEKQGRKVPMVFQDPAFKSSEEFVLSALAEGEVVEHPDAVKYMTSSSFVFTPYVQNDVFASTILHKRPVLYIGNNVDSDYIHPMGQVLARKYIRKVYMTSDHTFGPDMQEFVRQTDAFHSYYEKHILDHEYDQKNDLVAAFRNVWVHHPKEQHSISGFSNEPALRFTAVRSISTKPSTRRRPASADAMSSASDDTALSSTFEDLCVK
ncbi:hypothetical protein QM012_008724 [Aureobasidium pullulans]|uniref:SRR1-like domain-containing protein n=1 Tax=Aureobasidium pullulans TaxID=5580 RepID=A0ABR0THF8_AURPU